MASSAPSPIAAMSSAASQSHLHIASRLDRFNAPTVWQEFTPLAKATGAVNLGQGFPDWETPAFIKDAMVRAVSENHNQYTRSAGHPALCQVLAKRYASVFGRPIDWETEVTIGVGATEVLYATMQALVNPGDEVVLISPAFDIYSAQVQMAGGKCVYVPLRLGKDSAGNSEWQLDMAELRAAFTPRTRMVLLNSPQNPTGKMFTTQELQAVADILADFPSVVAVSDEVYEHMVYGGETLPRLANLPGMWDRVLTVSSGGKSFSTTGWKVGWAVGPAPLVRGLVLTNQWVQFSVSTPAQQAIAYALEDAEKPFGGAASYFEWLTTEYTRKRAVLMQGLASAGLRPVCPAGGFFIMADTSNVVVPDKYLAETSPACGPVMRRDWALCRWLTQEIGVAAIPPSAFYEEKDKELAANVARFAFCKEDASLYEASQRLQKVRAHLRDASVLPSLPPVPTPAQFA